ncbi:hypothetical protein [Mesorhizobium sp. CN2-181]|uniref:hypothetical protein n=1 Tax=Mesorhizobium yinganensis TaxID=3157707 RepID=UPI0032B72F03
MTGRVDPPKRMHDYPDRDIDCQQAVEREVQELIAAAPRDLVKLTGVQGTINVNSWAPDGTRFAFVAYPVN